MVMNIYERLSDEKSFARIRSKGDTALFGGKTTEQMKQKLNIPRRLRNTNGLKDSNAKTSVTT
jgi:hypothetical protein